MSPSQSTPLIEAADRLKDIKDSQRHAFDTAMELINRMPFTALHFFVQPMRHNREFQWGVQVSVHAVAVALFPELAVELGAVRKTDVRTSGRGVVDSYELLVGSLAGVPFELSAYMGSQRVEAAAA